MGFTGRGLLYNCSLKHTYVFCTPNILCYQQQQQKKVEKNSSKPTELFVKTTNLGLKETHITSSEDVTWNV